MIRRLKLFILNNFNKNSKNPLWQLESNIDAWSAMTLAIPIMGILLVETGYIFQGFIYSFLSLGLIGVFLFQLHIHFSKTFMFLMFVFFVLWLLPNLINLQSGTLESEAILISVMIYHQFFMMIVLLWLYLWQTNNKRGNLEIFCRSLLIIMSPIMFCMFAKIFINLFADMDIPKGFTYRHFDAEFIIMWVLLGFYLKGKFIRWIFIFIAFLAMLMMQVRGGLLALLIFINLAYIFPYLKKVALKKSLQIVIIILVVGLIFKQEIFHVLNNIFLIESPDRGLGSGLTQRMHIWQIAWDNIQAHPWTGIGYYVRPNPFNDPTNSSFQVHNILLRIWVENGTPLFLYICMILGLTVYNIERKKLNFERAAFYSIMFYYFFIPRHIQLNPMSILLYLIIIRALIVVDKKKKLMV